MEEIGAKHFLSLLARSFSLPLDVGDGDSLPHDLLSSRRRDLSTMCLHLDVMISSAVSHSQLGITISTLLSLSLPHRRLCVFAHILNVAVISTRRMSSPMAILDSFIILLILRCTLVEKILWSAKILNFFNGFRIFG